MYVITPGNYAIKVRHRLPRRFQDSSNFLFIFRKLPEAAVRRWSFTRFD